MREVRKMNVFFFFLDDKFRKESLKAVLLLYAKVDKLNAPGFGTLATYWLPFLRSNIPENPPIFFRRHVHDMSLVGPD